jgi:hypothetical protein
MARQRRNRWGESKYSPRRIRAARKHLLVIEMLLEGKTRKQIAAAVGYRNITSVTKAAESALKRTLQEPCDELRNERVARWRVAEAANWPGVEAGEKDAIDTHAKIDRRLSDLLGLDAPAKLEHSGELGLTGEVKVDHDYGRLIEALKRPEFRALASGFIRGLGAKSS